MVKNTKRLEIWWKRDTKGLFITATSDDDNYKGRIWGKYEGCCIDDKKEGKGVFTYSNGDIYEGDWVSGQRNG